jgi:hypothetical protein
LPVLERGMTEEIRLVIPAQADFRPIAHLVTGGLALRLDLTYDELEDLQVALEAALGLRDDEHDVTVVLGVRDGTFRTAVGPFAGGALGELDGEGDELGLRRVFETVADSFEVDDRDDGVWLELTKRVATAAGAT